MCTWCMELGDCIPQAATSVVFKQRKQIIVAVVGEIGRSQVGEQLIRIRQLRKKLSMTHKEWGYC